MPGDTVTMVSPQGQATEVPAEQAQAWAARGFTTDTAEGAANRAAAQSVQANASTLEATGQGIARGATLGLSDVAQRALGGEDARLHLQQLEQAHPIASTLGAVGGSFLTPGIGAIGDAVRGGGGLARATLAGIAEGGVYGAGNAVSELAVSQDPLTAEHIASTLSSNVLFGGAVGGGAGLAFSGIERGLQKANEAFAGASASKAAIDGLPAELAGADDKTLQAAYKTAGEAHAADIAAEKQSLEGLRVQQRAEVANQVRDLHEDLASERPIFAALSNGEELNPSLKGIDGASDARVQLAKSYNTMRTRLDDPIGIARDPYPLLKPLEMRQAGLEALQERMPQLRAAMMGDGRAGMLDHVDQALADTKQQIAQIRGLSSRENPVVSGRLTQLQAGPSAQMEAIANARAARAATPELGPVATAAKAAAFGGGAAIAHMTGAGFASPFVGKLASDAVGKLFERMAGGAAAAGERASGITQQFASASSKAASAAPILASRVLAGVRFGQGPSVEAAPANLGEAFERRSAEIRSQTAYDDAGVPRLLPDARSVMAQRLAPIRAVNPVMADRIETIATRKIEFLSSKLPRKPSMPGIAATKLKPSDIQMRTFARYVDATEHPEHVEQRLLAGTVSPEDAEAYRSVYPERFAQLSQMLVQEVATTKESIPYARRMAMSIFTGTPCDPSLDPMTIATFQGHFARENNSQGGSSNPTPSPQFGSIKKSAPEPTPADKRAQGQLG